MTSNDIQKIRLTASFHDYHLNFWIWLAAILLVLAGFGIRMVDLYDQPLDFHPTRQLRGAIVARSIYYSIDPQADPELRSKAVTFAGKTGQYEPPLLEYMVAFAYKFMGGENLWVARVINSFFWVVGGIALFLLAARMTNSGAALISLMYYLFLPFAIQASRSFQPDPGMVMCLLLCLYALYRWSYHQIWKWVIWTGLFGGMAVLTKAVAGYMIAVTSIFTVLATLGLKRSFTKVQVWFMAALLIAPTLVFYLLQNQGRATEYFSSWTIALSHLLYDPATYVRWFNLIQSLMGISVLVLAAAGVVISKSRERTFLIALWIGYLIYGLTVPYQMYTHNYYHLMFIPLLALSITPTFQLILNKINAQKVVWRILFIASLLVVVAFLAGSTAQNFVVDDYRHEPAYWQKIGSQLPEDGKILALTQDYGYRLLYYGWRKVVLWRPSGELELAELRGWEKEFEDHFSNKIAGMDYFLVTAFNQFDKQPQLKEYLYANYPIFSEAKGYLIFDLSNPLTP